MLASAHALGSDGAYNWVYTLIGVVVILGFLLGGWRWAVHNVVRPLKVVTGEPETDDDPGKPSLYKLTKEAKATGEKALGLAQQAADDAAYVRTQVAPSNGRRTAELVEDQGAKINQLVLDVGTLKDDVAELKQQARA